MMFSWKLLFLNFTKLALGVISSGQAGKELFQRIVVLLHEYSVDALFGMGVAWRDEWTTRQRPGASQLTSKSRADCSKRGGGVHPGKVSVQAGLDQQRPS